MLFFANFHILSLLSGLVFFISYTVFFTWRLTLILAMKVIEIIKKPPLVITPLE